MDKKTEKIKIYVQFLLAAIIVSSGIVLLFIGFATPPTGEIDNSVLVAWGEGLTFVGSIIGIDYSYKKKRIGNKEDK